MGRKKAETFPLRWHRECLWNSTASLVAKREQLERLLQEVAKHAEDVERLRQEITQAEISGATHMSIPK